MEKSKHIAVVSCNMHILVANSGEVVDVDVGEVVDVVVGEVQSF
jgi:hypothetical protein